jgi:hypothetical protein
MWEHSRDGRRSLSKLEARYEELKIQEEEFFRTTPKVVRKFLTEELNKLRVSEATAYNRGRLFEIQALLDEVLPILQAEEARLHEYRRLQQQLRRG